MQDVWQEVSENKSIYGRLWSFGVRSLRFRECGLYEASDLLLGDHLTEKSDPVKWIDVSMPHKRNRRLKDHRVLQEIAKKTILTTKTSLRKISSILTILRDRTQWIVYASMTLCQSTIGKDSTRTETGSTPY